LRDGAQRSSTCVDERRTAPLTPVLLEGLGGWLLCRKLRNARFDLAELPQLRKKRRYHTLPLEVGGRVRVRGRVTVVGFRRVTVVGLRDKGRPH